ncbi:MAG: flagellar assembly peptidoglycan hydrolase FlgJ [Enterobacteriaceae bacterium]|jgi:flagellar protein FlgJ|nr:flagellar assembly peptidoglycan hydrolase FlgJ [Enterobacteriaceae bacterium]
MNNFALSQGAAFDQHSLDALKTATRQRSPEALQAVAKQMEGLFVQMMLKSMREASFKDGLFNTSQSAMFTSMYDQQIAQHIAETGKMGFARLMAAHMGGNSPQSTGDMPAVSSSLSPLILPERLPELMASARYRAQKAPLQSAVPEAGGMNGSFISRLRAPALAVARQSGIFHQLIIAQAALESGWGNREIPTQDGKPSHNLFGIKASPDWQGETTEITTTEYQDGVPRKVKAVFRVYSSYTDALADYTSLLTNNPRYRHVLTSSTPENAAKALQSAGYATDPAYAKKLIGIIQQVKNGVKQAVNAYNTDFSSLF